MNFYLYEYHLKDRHQRQMCNLRIYKDIITDVYHQFIPGAKLFFQKHSFFVISKEAIKRGGLARDIGKALCKYPALTEYGVKVRTKNGAVRFDLFRKKAGMELNLQAVTNIYNTFGQEIDEYDE